MTVQVITPEVVLTGNNSELSPGEWAARINQRYCDGVDAVLDVGRMLIAAKAALPYGDYAAMIESDLLFGVRAAQQFVRIAQHPVLQRRNIVSYLPASWGTLASIARLPGDVVEKMIETGQITPKTKRREIDSFITRMSEQEQRDSAPHDEVHDAARPTGPPITAADQTCNRIIRDAIRHIQESATKLEPRDPGYRTCACVVEDLFSVINNVLKPKEQQAKQANKVPPPKRLTNAKRRLTNCAKKAETARRTALAVEMGRTLAELEKELREIRDSLKGMR